MIGVGPPDFRGTEPYLNLDLFVPMMMQSSVITGDRLNARDHAWLDVIARLKPGVSIERAQADLSLVAEGLAAAYPDDQGHGIRVYPLWQAPASGGPAVTALMGIELGVAGVILLIACANVGKSRRSGGFVG